jgi:hypothetical protein
MVFGVSLKGYVKLQSEIKRYVTFHSETKGYLKFNFILRPKDT